MYATFITEPIKCKYCYDVTLSQMRKVSEIDFQVISGDGLAISGQIVPEDNTDREEIGIAHDELCQPLEKLLCHPLRIAILTPIEEMILFICPMSQEELDQEEERQKIIEMNKNLQNDTYESGGEQ